MGVAVRSLDATAASILFPSPVPNIRPPTKPVAPASFDLEETRELLPGQALEGTTRATKPRAVLAPGTSLGRYVVLDKLGEGGMGVVYAAHDSELRRKVALKVLQGNRPSDLTTSGHARLLREAQSLAQLAHPNVVAVHDVGTFEGDVFMAMEFVEGQTLRQWLAAGQRHWREVLRVFREASLGLAAAHDKELVHRDFKPDNVLIAQSGRVYVMDFGIARQTAKGAEPELWSPAPETLAQATSDGTPLSTPLTQVGTVLGTLPYMSPELFEGAPASASSDLFAFCVSLYEALYGERPFKRLHPFARPPPWELQDAPRRTQVPAWLRRVVVKGLDLAPAARYASMHALATALASDPAVRRKRVLGISGAVALIGVAGAGAYQLVNQRHQLCQIEPQRLAGVWDEPLRGALERTFLGTGKAEALDAWARTRALLDGYASAWLDLRRDACSDTRIRGSQSDAVLALRMGCLDRRLTGLQALVEVLGKPGTDIVSQGVKAASSLTPLDGCNNVAALSAPVPPPEDAQTRAQVTAARHRLAQGKALLDSGKYPEGVQLARALVADLEPLHYRPLQAEALDLLGLLEVKAGQLEDADHHLQRALWAAQAGGHLEESAQASTRLALVAAKRERFEESLGWYELAKAQLERLGPSPLLEADLEGSIGDVFYGQHRSHESISHHLRALQLRVRALGAFHPLVASSHSEVGVQYASMGQYQPAIASFKAALAIDERALGPLHPDTVVGLHRLALAMLCDGDASAETEQYMRRAFEIRKAAFGSDNLAVGFSEHSLAELHLFRGHYAAALAAAEHARSIYAAKLGPSHTYVAGTLQVMADAQAGLGDLPGALASVRRAQELIHRQVHPSPEYLSDVEGRVALVLQPLGHRTEALRLLERAVVLVEKSDEHNVQADAFERLGTFYLRAGQPRLAHERFSRALAVRERSNGVETALFLTTLSGLGQADEALGEYPAAREMLQRALKLRGIDFAARERVGTVRLALARVLRHEGVEASQARALAQRARTDFEQGEGPRLRALMQIDAFLQTLAQR